MINILLDDLLDKNLKSKIKWIYTQCVTLHFILKEIKWAAWIYEKSRACPDTQSKKDDILDSQIIPWDPSAQWHDHELSPSIQVAPFKQGLGVQSSSPWIRNKISIHSNGFNQ